MELDLTADQEMFAQTTTKFLDDEASPTDLRALRHDPTGFSPGYWRQGAELRLDVSAGFRGRRGRQHQW